VLAVIGGAAGILLALWLGGVLNAQAGRLPLPIEFDLTMDRRLLVHALLLSIVTSILCGLAPARRATRFDVVPALKEGDHAPARQRVRRWLVVGQIAMSCPLLMWGGLFLRSLVKAQDVHPGFDAAGVLLASLELDSDTFDAPAMAAWVDELQSEVREIPGVQSAGISTVVPLSLTGREEYRARADSDPADERGRWVMANRVGPDWMRTLHLPLLAGRDFTRHDRSGSPPVVVVNETLAKHAWNGQALGRRLNGAEVIGVVGDSKYWTLGETVLPTVYTPFAQRPMATVNLFVRTSNTAAVAAALRAEIDRRNPGLVAEIEPMSEAIGAALLPAQVGAVFTSGFGAIGMLLTMMAIYGLVSFTVAQRRREIGIRKAIGAKPSDIVASVMRGISAPVAIGLTIGVASGSLGATVLRGFIVGVSPIDPLTIAATAVLVLITAATASALPALSASRVDPMKALRGE
jgi:predicted permease